MRVPAPIRRPARTTRLHLPACGLPLAGLGAAALLAVALGAAAPAAGAARGAATSSGGLHVVVRGAPGQGPDLAAALRARGGKVTSLLPVIDGFSAQVSDAEAARLARQPGVLAVTPDAPVRLSSIDPSLGYDAAADFGSLYDITRVTRTQDAWRAGWTGKGVDVALLDSGVAPVTGLTSGNLVNGPDLSFESQDPALAHLDTFGHGTHMAGIIAGRDVVSEPAAYTDPAHFTGVAPDSRLISVKVAASDGATDVSQVIAGINWVTEHARDPGFNIRVLNLSFGTDSVQDARLDPLVFAAESAWRRGIVVVVAGGNDGTAKRLLSDPAASPHLLAVGAQDPRGTITPVDDVVPPFASRGTVRRHVDLVAPAVHVLGLAVPGSFVDENYPEGKVGSRFQRGSGTSQATAVTTGAAALYLQKYPGATPDQVKLALMQGAFPFKGASEVHRGAGALDVRAALAIAPPGPPLLRTPAFGTGLGSLEAARGSAHVQDAGVDLVGEQDVFGSPFVSALWAPLAAAGRTWTGGSWNGSVWTGDGWAAGTWTGLAWAPGTWTGSSWAGTPWSGRTWTGRTWTSAGWSAGSWTGAGWAGTTWTGRTWTSQSWTDGGVAGAWSGASWN